VAKFFSIDDIEVIDLDKLVKLLPGGRSWNPFSIRGRYIGARYRSVYRPDISLIYFVAGYVLGISKSISRVCTGYRCSLFGQCQKGVARVSRGAGVGYAWVAQAAR